MILHFFRATSAIVILALLVSPADSDDSVVEISDDQLVSLLKETGLSNVQKGNLDRPESLVKIQIDGREVGVVNNSETRQLQLVVILTDSRARSDKLQLANHWNQTQPLDRVVILKSNAWALARDLSYREGTTAEAIRQSINDFTHTIRRFITYVQSSGRNLPQPTLRSDGHTEDLPLERIFTGAGASQFTLEGVEREGVSYRVNFGELSLAAVYSKQRGLLALCFTQQHGGRLTEKTLERANAWNDEPGIGRATLVDVDLGSEPILFWNLRHDLDLSHPLPKSAVNGFIRDFHAASKHFQEFAVGSSDVVPELHQLATVHTPDVVTRPVEPKETDEALTRFWFSVVDFRHVCATKGMEGWEQYADPELLRIVDQLNMILWENDGEIGWSYFFARSLFDIGRADSGNPIVGFYHPWADVWLVTEWSLAPKLRITDMEAVTGEWMRKRGKPPIDVRPDWLRRDGYRPEQFAITSIENLKQLQSLADGARDWRETLGINDQWEQFNEINYPAAGLLLNSALLRSQEAMLGGEAFDEEQLPPADLQQAVAATYQFLAAGREGKISPLVDAATATNAHSAGLVKQLPVNDFNRFVPTYWLIDERYAQVFLVADHNVDFYLVLTFDRQADKRDLARVDFLHLPTIAQVLEKREISK